MLGLLCRRTSIVILFLAILTPPAFGANECLHPYYWQALTGDSPAGNNCFGSTGFRCYEAIDSAWYFALKNPSCDPTAGTCDVQLRVPLEFPGVEQMVAEDGLFGSPTPWVFWFSQATAPECPRGTANEPDCGQDVTCGTLAFGGKLNSDKLETWVERADVSCENAKDQTGVYSIRVRVCNTACFRPDVVVEGMTFATPKLARDIGCPQDPPPNSCPNDADCKSCTGGGMGIGGGGAGAGGDGGAGGPDSGGGAYLYYAAGGVGHPGLPGTADWTPTLGRYWSHSYAARIVEDPDASHVWLLTEHGTFREFGNPDAGGVYETLAPSDEYRTLTATGTG